MSLSTQLKDNGDRSHRSVTASTSGAVHPASGRPDRGIMAVEFYNYGSNTIFIFNEDNREAAEDRGRPVASGGEWADALSVGPWYLFTSSGESDVRITEVRRP